MAFACPLLWLSILKLQCKLNLFHCSTDQKVQKRASLYILLVSIALTVPAMLTACFLGAWSDKRGRKGPFLFAAIGSSLASLIFLVAIHWELPIYVFMIGKGWLLLISSCVSSCLN